MGGSSSQPRTDPALSPINAFLVEELYTPEFLNSLQDNTGYWQAPNPHESLVEQVAASPTKKKKATHNRQKRMIESNDVPRQTPWTTEEEIALAKGWLAISKNSKHGNARRQDCPKWKEIAIPNFNTEFEGGSKRHKSSGSSSFNTEYGEASINLNTTVSDKDEDEMQEIRRPEGRDKARAAGRKNKGTRSAGSSNVNEDAFARREVECRKRELKQQDMRFYLQPCDHLTGDQRKEMDEINAKIKPKYNLRERECTEIHNAKMDKEQNAQIEDRLQVKGNQIHLNVGFHDLVTTLQSSY
ncbi:hypothetical protein Tco_0026151 [Tanacetum coccineum]